MDGAYYREKAERCRLLFAIAMVPEIKEQLRLWTHEFDDLADAADKRQKRQQRACGVGGSDCGELSVRSLNVRSRTRGATNDPGRARHAPSTC